MTRTEAAIALHASGVSMAEACRQAQVKPTTVYAELRKRGQGKAKAPQVATRGSEPVGPTMIAITVPGAWLRDPGYIASLLDDAGVPVHEEFPKQRVTRGTLSREDDPARGAVRFVWRA